MIMRIIEMVIESDEPSQAEQTLMDRIGHEETLAIDCQEEKIICIRKRICTISFDRRNILNVKSKYCKLKCRASFFEELKCSIISAVDSCQERSSFPVTLVFRGLSVQHQIQVKGGIYYQAR